MDHVLGGLGLGAPGLILIHTSLDGIVGQRDSSVEERSGNNRENLVMAGSL